ncbi:MAG TPA: hypothetical protein VMV69_08040 [Pirellulales bacterium]|nr:hypothetical protein [Pirellulales bacterium]
MERVGVMICLLVLLVAPAGCGCAKSTEADSNATAEGGPAGNKEASRASDGEAEGPAEAVFAFLEAVRTGDDAKANAMLTQLAREKTAELDMVVAPPGSETASFEVGEVELVPPEQTGADEETAHVACTWTDIDDDGEPHADEIIWALRHEPEGWRIAGMATKIFEDQPPLLLNFEDPEDMQRKQDLAEKEMERRARQDADEFAGERSTESTAADDADDEAQNDMADERPKAKPDREVRETQPKAKANRR